MSFSVSIVGKPNVGKSTLFNRLTGRRLAIIHDRPGVTRDRKIAKSQFEDFTFDLVDTAGWDKSKDVIAQGALIQTNEAIINSDCIIFVVDARHGLTYEDYEFAKLVRKAKKDVILVANKSEGKKSIETNDLFKLGFGESLFVSAEHNLGIDMLNERLKQIYNSLKPKKVETDEQVDHQIDEQNLTPEKNEILKVCIIGRPNVGKSTLFNAALGFERVVVSEVAGTTRDAINHELTIDDQVVELIDTAGLRKRKNITDSVETLSTVETINAIRRSHVAILTIDIQAPFEHQDLSIARVAIQEGKPIVIAVNKADLVDKKIDAYKEEIEYLVEKNMFEIKGAPIVFISAKKKINVKKIFKQAFILFKRWNKEISTAKLNSWLEGVSESHIPPIANNGRRLRFKYITQIARKPPTFSIFCNIPSDVPESYTRYLYNSLREVFKLDGIPIRMKYKKNKNPYAKD
jgi:GTP-binding protein